MESVRNDDVLKDRALRFVFRSAYVSSGDCFVIKKIYVRFLV